MACTSARTTPVSSARARRPLSALSDGYARSAIGSPSYFIRRVVLDAGSSSKTSSRLGTAPRTPIACRHSVRCNRSSHVPSRLYTPGTSEPHPCWACNSSTREGWRPTCRPRENHRGRPTGDRRVIEPIAASRPCSPERSRCPWRWETCECKIDEYGNEWNNKLNNN
jgi:hypothetical protein